MICLRISLSSVKIFSLINQISIWSINILVPSMWQALEIWWKKEKKNKEFLASSCLYSSGGDKQGITTESVKCYDGASIVCHMWDHTGGTNLTLGNADKQKWSSRRIVYEGLKPREVETSRNELLEHRIQVGGRNMLGSD